ncbi:hypothetical protein NADFUDRAFT_80969 [Nadsonia fulvescens var. elongata DSM 6958]|uniref:Large ribosomal subunit protein mL40 n=1 Tax=Nadsonia fulvescens var. elongata DSM 6958 TaxID=857566 RepID=A0A1E3PQY3_9ASCO|nr:hypothetical protein NADFUDRAFT_80969 [Nadsonia fulvescens var. elongata DSM 6958]
MNKFGLSNFVRPSIFRSHCLGSIKTPTSVSTFVRFARTSAKKKNRGELSASQVRQKNLLSAVSGARKVPRKLDMCVEDLIRHNTVTRAWALYQKEIRDKRAQNLERQYRMIDEACDALKSAGDRNLYNKATKREFGKRFPMELRVPTDTPPKIVWQYEWSPEEKEKK